MNILIIDDHAIFRAGLKQLLLEELSGVKVYETGDGVTALNMIRDKQWDVILLDINLPGKNGIEILKGIKQVNSKQPVLMLSMYSEEQYAVRAMRAGAAGYLTKDVLPDELVKAIRQVAEGHRYINPSLAEVLAIHLNTADHEDEPHKLLSDREYDIFSKLSSGKTVSEIAGLLLLSVKTISTYRSRILHKMNLKNNAELMQYAVINNLHTRSIDR